MIVENWILREREEILSVLLRHWVILLMVWLRDLLEMMNIIFWVSIIC